MPRRSVYDADLRERLISSAALVLTQRGVDGLSLRPLAASEGTSTSAVYAMFGGKQGLVAAVVDAAQAGFTASQRAVPVTDDPVTDLRALGHAYRDWALRHPTLYAVMFGGQVVPGCADATAGDDEAIAPLRAVVRRAVAAGHFGGQGVELIALSIWASVHGLVSLEISGLLGTDEAAARQGYEMHLAAIERGWRR